MTSYALIDPWALIIISPESADWPPPEVFTVAREIDEMASYLNAPSPRISTESFLALA